MGQPHYDALIGGGGPSGLASAVALLERGVSVILLEPQLEPFTPRAEMLPPAAEPIIFRLGIEAMLDCSVALGPTLGLWDSAQPRLQDHALGMNSNAISIDRRELTTHLQKRVLALGGSIHAGRVTKIGGHCGDWRVSADAVDFRARFLIDGTGRSAKIARRLGARLSLGPKLVAQTVLVAEKFAPRLVVEATQNGWWYALPLQNCGTIGFVSGPGTAPEVPKLLPTAGATFNAQIWDARNTRLSPCVGPGWLAIGDAAAAFDPIAAQGLFNALSGGFFAGNAAADWLAGRQEALKVYEELISRTAKRTHRITPRHYGSALGQTQFWQRRKEAQFTTGPDW